VVVVGLVGKVGLGKFKVKVMVRDRCCDGCAVPKLVWGGLVSSMTYGNQDSMKFL